LAPEALEFPDPLAVEQPGGTPVAEGPDHPSRLRPFRWTDNIKCREAAAAPATRWRATSAIVAWAGFGDQGEGYIRFSYASSIDNIQEAVARIRRFLERRND
jgi:hypothetical protein